jgi:hypothetical protein
MKDYFKTKLGKEMYYTVTSGDMSFNGIYRKKYSLEVIKVTDESVVFEIISNQYVPSGYCLENTSTRHGFIEIKFDNKNKLQIIYEALAKGDSEYFLKYGLNIRAIA